MATIQVTARRKVKKWVDRTLNNMPGPRKSFFPINVLEEGRRTGEKLEPILGWLRREGPPIAILAGKLGAGKTVATCMLQRTLNTQGDGLLDLWVPLRWIVRQTDSPLRDLLNVFNMSYEPDEIFDIPLRCLILDGVDEFIYRFSQRELQVWFEQLFREIEQLHSHPRLLLSGRDVAFNSQSVFTDLLHAFCARSRRFPRPCRFALEPWPENSFKDYLALRLEESLQPHFPTSVSTEVENRLRLVAPKILSSPLFYRLAYEYLSDPNLHPRFLADQRELMQEWVEKILSEQHLFAARFEDRLDAAIGIATYLALSGRGTAGATLQELQSAESLQGIWARLRSQMDSVPSDGDATLDPIFRRAVKELKQTTLMSCTENRYAPFHEQVLVHLAAEGISRILGAPSDPGDDSGGGDRPRLRYEPDLFSRAPLSLRSMSSLLRYERLFTLAQERAFVPFSTLEQALNYRMQTPRSEEALPLAPVRHLLHGGEPFDARRAVLVVARDAALRAHPDKQEVLLEDERQEAAATAAQVLSTTSLPDRVEVGGQVLLPIPAGEYLIWDVEEDFRRLVKLRREETVYLAQSPCTVEQYARFLTHQFSLGRDFELPRQPAAGWKLRPRGVTYEPTRAATPVTGITAAEAEEYCRWLGSQKLPESLGTARVGLPLPEILRVAIQGLEIWEQPPSAGAFGHMGLTSIWHWTAQQEGAQRVLVGGSPSIGSVEMLRRGWPTLDRRLPPGSYEPDTGFRVVLVPR